MNRIKGLLERKPGMRCDDIDNRSPEHMSYLEDRISALQQALTRKAAELKKAREAIEMLQSTKNPTERQLQAAFDAEYAIRPPVPIPDPGPISVSVTHHTPSSGDGWGII